MIREDEAYHNEEFTSRYSVNYKSETSDYTDDYNCSEIEDGVSDTFVSRQAPPGLFPFVPAKDQKDFYYFCYQQFRFWKKERSRIAYAVRKSLLSNSQLHQHNRFSTVFILSLPVLEYLLNLLLHLYPSFFFYSLGDRQVVLK